MQEDPPRHMTEGVVANLASLYELLGDKYVRPWGRASACAVTASMSELNQI